MICVHTEIDTPVYSISLIIAVKSKADYRIHAVPMLFCILQQQKDNITEVVYFRRPVYHHNFETLYGASVASISQAPVSAMFL